MDLQHIQDAGDYIQTHSHKVLDTFVAAFIGYGLFGSFFGFLETYAALFVSLSAIIGGLLGVYRWYLAYKESKEHQEDRLEKAAQKKIAEAKIKGIEHFALTDEEILNKAEMIKIRANGKHEYKPLSKKK